MRGKGIDALMEFVSHLAMCFSMFLIELQDPKP